MDKTKLAVALLILGLAIGTCIGYGVLSIPQPRFVFDLMMLLTFIWMLIWTIRKKGVPTTINNLTGPTPASIYRQQMLNTP